MNFAELFKFKSQLAGSSAAVPTPQSNERIIASPHNAFVQALSTTTQACNTAQPVTFIGGCTRFRAEYDGRFFAGVNTAYEADIAAPVSFTAAFYYPYACFTGSISGTTLTVTAATLGQLAIGATVSGGTISAGTTIVSQLTSTETGGKLGGKGTYQLSATQTTMGSTALLNAETLHSRLTFQGSYNGTLNPGAIGYASDWLEVSIPAGGVGRIRHYASVGALNQMPRGFNFNSNMFPGAQASAYNASGETDQTTNLAYAWVANNNNGNWLFCANRLVGTSNKRTLTIGYMGDSVTWGTGYTADLGLGYLGQMLNASFNSANYGFPGERGYYATQLPSMANFRVREALARRCDVVNWAWASNDFHYLTGSASSILATMQTTAFTMWADILSRGTKIIAATCTPQSTSSDSWISDANQTPLAAWASGGAAQLWNAWLRDGAPLTGSIQAGFVAAATGASGGGIVRIGQTGHPVVWLNDVASYCESQTKVGVWRSDGGVQWSPDGVHPLLNTVNAIIAGLQTNYIAQLRAIEATLV